MTFKWTVPLRSSGETWTPKEDETLQMAIVRLTAEMFPGRSVAAVITRLEMRKMAICRNLNDEADLDDNYTLELGL